PRLMLHAYRLAFEHPFTGRPASFEAEPPADFNKFWRSLK
ncbi:MAG: RluA family pseudouridine synthase, partial [Elusimicrobia bacterium]|nr:RluA family pseudouridine synthase [Elusimicrobiota bacterium]